MRLYGRICNGNVSGKQFSILNNAQSFVCLQATSHIGSQFIFIHYNETEPEDNDTTVTPSGRVQGYWLYMYSYRISWCSWI